MGKQDDEIQKLAEERDNLLKTLEEVRAKMAKEPPAEAGFSMNFTMKHPTVGAAQFTFRGVTCNDWSGALDAVRDFAGHATAHGWEFNVLAQAAAPVPSKAVQIAQEEGTPEAVEAVKAAVEDVGKYDGFVDCVKLEITPEVGDRVSLAFYEDGHKYPDLRVQKWQVPQATGLLRHVTAQSLDKKAEVSLKCRVYYTTGKEYVKKGGSKGNYKDVVAVR